MIEIQNQEQVKNTWYRSPKVSPHINKTEEGFLELRNTEGLVVRIEVIQEIVLYLIASFKYMSYWLVLKWWSDVKRNNIEAAKEIESWINIGLIWTETSPTGVYLRPTKLLLDLYKEPTYYIPIPYNTLTHNISEAQVLFDIMIGNPKSELWNIIKDEEILLPHYHFLLSDLNNKDRDPNLGTIIIRETEFRTHYKKLNREQLLENENLIHSEIQAGKRFTSELTDFKLFPIVTYNQESDLKGEIYTQNSDLIVPIPRDEKGNPRSYAIEIELTAKSAEKYDLIMRSYKNNIKFGKVFYLVGTQRIAKLVKDAFTRVGGLGTCQLYIVPFSVPTMELENFSREAEVLQMKLIVDSLKKNN